MEEGKEEGEEDEKEEEKEDKKEEEEEEEGEKGFWSIIFVLNICSHLPCVDIRQRGNLK